MDGELIGVSFAIPARGGRGLTYHIHAAELREFLKNRPTKPLLYAPDPWPPAALSAIVDIDQDGIPETVLFGVQRGEAATGFLIDLDEDSSSKLSPEMLLDAERRRSWDFEFAYQDRPIVRSFYDTNNDGSLDLVLVDRDRDGEVDRAFRLDERGVWVQEEPSGHKIIEPSLFKDAALRNRLEKVLTALAIQK